MLRGLGPGNDVNIGPTGWTNFATTMLRRTALYRDGLSKGCSPSISTRSYNYSGRTGLHVGYARILPVRRRLKI